ncbi:MAG: hypothetical protein GY804_09630 [Alphaproteobacteria bacterium]|nr:hypothetical protein [Alphaproteobacteria bacterium]
MKLILYAIFMLLFVTVMDVEEPIFEVTGYVGTLVLATMGLWLKFND